MKDKNQKIVAHTTDGQPLTKEAYFQKLQQAEIEIGQGNFFTTEQLRHKVAEWEIKYGK